MIRKLTPGKLIIIGVVLNLVGFVLPLLMVIQLIESTFFLNFTAYSLSVIGLVVGLIGMVFLVKVNRQ